MMESAQDRSDSDPTVHVRRLRKGCQQAEAAVRAVMVVHFEVTAHPTAAWVWRQLIEATPWDTIPINRQVRSVAFSSAT